MRTRAESTFTFVGTRLDSRTDPKNISQTPPRRQKQRGQDIPCQQRKRIRWLHRSPKWSTLRSRFWTTSPQFKRLAQVPRIATSWSHGSGKYLPSTGGLTVSWAARGRKLLLATYARMPLMRTSGLRRFIFPHPRCDREQTTILLKQGPHRPRPVQRPIGAMIPQ
jgi:hypothetical protein